MCSAFDLTFFSVSMFGNNSMVTDFKIQSNSSMLGKKADELVEHKQLAAFVDGKPVRDHSHCCSLLSGEEAAGVLVRSRTVELAMKKRVVRGNLLSNESKS